MISQFLYRRATAFFTTRLGRWLADRTGPTPFGSFLVALILPSVMAGNRRAAINYLAQLPRFAERRRSLVRATGFLARRSERIEVIETHWLVLAKFGTGREAAEVLFSEDADALVASHPKNANLPLDRALSAYDAGHHRIALENFECAFSRDPELVDSMGIGLCAAYSAGLVLRPKTAMKFLSQCFWYVDRSEDYADTELRVQFLKHAFLASIGPLVTRLAIDFSAKGKKTRYGIFFLSSTHALGHAILDPYYFLALRREKFDRIFFLGPPKASYRPASASCLKIVEQYGDYVEVFDNALLNFSWMYVGTHQYGPAELCIEHYWSLLREAVARTRDQNDHFQHNAWHLSLPSHLNTRHQRFCEDHGIDLKQPLVVVHMRNSSYHQLEKQAYRDTDIENYRPAIYFLLAEGYSVIRIGDAAMPRLSVHHERYFELPFLEDYRPELDPFFISKSAFMIGCQSGPCAYARVLGVPILSVNAVLHYTLLPSTMEMACFKRYVRIEGHHETDMTLEEALDADAQHLDTTESFSRASIEVRNSEPDEIIAAVRDMIAWLAQPDMPETGHQARFREAVEQKTCELSERSDMLDLPIADYLGIALPGYRISPTVALMRERMTRAERASEESTE
jgi:putative glycosyltransferase (TIGR04372 family)